MTKEWFLQIRVAYSSSITIVNYEFTFYVLMYLSLFVK